MLPLLSTSHAREPQPNVITRLAFGWRAYSDASHSLVLPPTVVPGDLLYAWPGSVAGLSGAMSSAGAGAYKILTPADIAAALSLTGPGLWAVYRGAFALAVRTNVTGPAASSPTIPGFTKSGNCAGLIFAGTTGSSATAPATVGTPLTQLVSVSPGSAGVHYSIGDLQDPAAYADGAGIPMGVSSNGSGTGYILEATF